MLLYHGKKIESALVGARVVEVQCDKCGCKYFYQLARIGTGSTTAHYGIAESAAAVSSRQKSQVDLQDRLAHEAELVPCPKCNWINDELVQGYRLGRFRHTGMLALGVGIVGTASSLIAAYFTWMSQPCDRELLDYFLFAGPALFISISLTMLLIRMWARKRIQPNRDFPLAPRLPPGSPPAFLVDEASGELRTAGPLPHKTNGSGEWCEFQIGRDLLPPVCCDCTHAPTAGSGYKAVVTTALALEIPRCESCASRSRRKSRIIWFATAAITLLVASGALFAAPLDSVQYWILFAACSLVTLAIASCAASMMTAPVKVRIVDGSRGIVRLRFRNPSYDPGGISLVQEGTTVS